MKSAGVEIDRLDDTRAGVRDGETDSLYLRYLCQQADNVRVSDREISRGRLTGFEQPHQIITLPRLYIRRRRRRLARVNCQENARQPRQQEGGCNDAG